MTAPAGPVILEADNSPGWIAVQRFAAGDHYRWWIGPGRRSADPHSIAPVRLAALVPANAASSCDWVPPAVHTREAVHHTTAAMSAAFWLRIDRAVVDHVLPALHTVGGALDRLHQVTTPKSADLPPAVTRLLRLLTGTAPQPSAACLYELTDRSWCQVAAVQQHVPRRAAATARASRPGRVAPRHRVQQRSGRVRIRLAPR